MNLSNLIDILEVKEQELLAFTSIYKDKIQNVENLQRVIDNVANNMANTFIKKYHEYLVDDDIIINLRKYICNMGADKKHSGKRVLEALYKQLDDLKQSIQKF